MGGIAATAGIGLCVLLLAYARLLDALRTRHPSVYRDLGAPPLANASPRKSLALQRFVYTRGWRHPDDRALRALCRFVGIFTPLFVALLTVQAVLLIRLGA